MYQIVNPEAIDSATLSARLRACQEQGITYQEIAQAANLSRTAVSQLANKGVAMREPNMIRVAAALSALYKPEQAEDSAPAQTAEEAPKQATETTPTQAAPTNDPRRHLGIYPTADLTKLAGWLNTLYRNRQIGALVGYPGSGKTTALKEYCRVNPDAHYILCVCRMTLKDLIGVIADKAGVQLTRRSLYGRITELMDALRGRTDVMILLDEAVYMKGWNVEKFDVIRQIWDETRTPIVFCGTMELANILTRGMGRDNCAQLYRRNWQCVTSGMEAAEAKAILAGYNIAPEAAEQLIKIATDYKHGGMGNYFELLRICAEAAEGGRIDSQIVRDATQYKLLY